MGRLVTPKEFTAKGRGPSANKPDKFEDRIAKYIPAETLTAYVGIQSVVGDKPEAKWWLPVFVLLVIGTPLYIRWAAKKNEPWGMHAIIATVAFLIWTYALHAEGRYSPWPETMHDATFAGILLILYSFFVGLLAPKPQG